MTMNIYNMHEVVNSVHIELIFNLLSNCQEDILDSIEEYNTADLEFLNVKEQVLIHVLAWKSNKQINIIINESKQDIPSNK